MMSNKKVLFIGGSLNQTRMVHAVSEHLKQHYQCFFTPFYTDGLMKSLSDRGLLDFTVLGGRYRQQTDRYIKQHELTIDPGGNGHSYDLVVTGSDLVIQKNIRNKPVVLVQEGITDPENWRFHLVKALQLPRYFAGTSMNGLSNAYQAFCVASEGYIEHFCKNGADRSKLFATGIPNFDNVKSFLNNDFPYQGYALVATSCIRETFRYDDRKAFLKSAIVKANGRSLIFKLHPNENVERATREIKALAPGALVFSEGNIEPMIANCEVLITQYSTVAYIGLALGKVVHSYFCMDLLRRQTPIQNDGRSAENIARICCEILENRQACHHRIDAVA